MDECKQCQSPELKGIHTCDEYHRRLGQSVLAFHEVMSNRWVSVNEVLPEKWVEVLVYYEASNMDGITSGYVNSIGELVVVSSSGNENDFITHWMPMPRKPRKEDA